MPKIAVVGTPVLPEMIRPRPLSGAHDLAQVVAHKWSLCALTRSGKVLCWSPDLDPLPPIANLENVSVRSITFDDGGLCAITTAGDVLCPRPVEAAQGSVQALAGSNFGCGLKSSGEVVCCGTAIPAGDRLQAPPTF
jgi:hypothetical protein